jgi:copper homeostasis protein
MQGSDCIRELVRGARGRIKLMVGSGVRAANVQKLASAIGAVEFHASLRNTQPSLIKYQVTNVHLGDVGVDDYARSAVGSADVRMPREAMNSAALSR